MVCPGGGVVFGAHSMTSTIIGALLPLVVVLFFGFLAGWRHHFDGKDASTLNRMVMLYAFPLSLFVNIMSVSRASLASQLPMAAAIFLSMVISFSAAILVIRYVFQRTLAEATLQGVAIGAAAVPFVGSAILPNLFGPATSAVAISSAGFAMNLVQTPVCMILLTIATVQSTPKKGGSFLTYVISAFKEPIVWAPLLATALVMANVRLPAHIASAFNLLGITTAGVALFASGVVLYSCKVIISLPVVITVCFRNLVIPALCWGVLIMLGMPKDVIREAVIALSIPVGTIVVIFSVRFKVVEQEMASSLFFSTILSVFTMAFFIVATR
jgi:predicted permease